MRGFVLGLGAVIKENHLDLGGVSFAAKKTYKERNWQIVP